MPKERAEAQGRTYTVGQLCEAVGIARTTLNTWRAKGWLPVAKADPLAWTRYSESDALRFFLLRTLGRSGITLSVAAQITSALYEEREFDAVLAGESRFVVISQIEDRSDEPKRPRGASYMALLAPRLSAVISATRRRSTENDAVWLVVDLAKVWRSAQRLLGGVS